MSAANCLWDIWDSVRTVLRTMSGHLAENTAHYQMVENSVPNCPELSVTIGTGTET